MDPRKGGWLLAGVFAALVIAIAFLTAHAWVRWSSDDAIPVLMSNDGHRAWFDLYYWGQDRLGGWAWKLAAGARWLTGVEWTPERLKVWHVAFALLGALVFPWRLGRAGWPAAVAWVLAATLLWRLPELHFALGQPYGAQGVFLVGALAFISREAPTCVDRVAATAFSFMANWESPASGPILVGAAAALLLARRPLELRRRAPPLFVPVILGAGLEVALRGLYQVGAKRMFGRSYAGQLKVDWDHLGENLRAMSAPFLAQPLLGATAVVAVVATVVVLVRPPRRPALLPLSGWLVALTAAASANFALTVLMAHVRLNFHDDRYLVPSYLLFTVAAVLALTLVVVGIRPWLVAFAPACVALLLWPIVSLARAPRTEESKEEREIVHVLRQAGARLLLGGYWDVYAVVALDPTRTIEGSVIEYDHDRTPWSRRLLDRKEGLWLIARESERVGQGERVSPVRLEYGHVLAVDHAGARAAGGAWVFPLRRLDGARALGTGVLPHLPAGCPGAHLSLGDAFPAGELWIRTDAHAPALRLSGQTPHGPASLSPAAAFAEHVRFDLPEPLGAPSLELPAGEARCTVYRAAWAPPADLPGAAATRP